MFVFEYAIDSRIKVGVESYEYFVFLDATENITSTIYELFRPDKAINIGIYYKKNLKNKIDEFELKNKWYGALSRRGFSLDIVKKVFDIKDIEKANLILEDNL